MSDGKKAEADSDEKKEENSEEEKKDATEEKMEVEEKKDTEVKEETKEEEKESEVMQSVGIGLDCSHYFFLLVYAIKCMLIFNFKLAFRWNLYKSSKKVLFNIECYGGLFSGITPSDFCMFLLQYQLV